MPPSKSHNAQSWYTVSHKNTFSSPRFLPPVFTAARSLFIASSENKYYLKQQIAVILNRFRNWKSYNKISSNHFSWKWQCRKRGSSAHTRSAEKKNEERNAEKSNLSPIIIIITIDFCAVSSLLSSIRRPLSNPLMPRHVEYFFSLLHILAENKFAFIFDRRWK